MGQREGRRGKYQREITSLRIHTCKVTKPYRVAATKFPDVCADRWSRTRCGPAASQKNFVEFTLELHLGVLPQGSCPAYRVASLAALVAAAREEISPAAPGARPIWLHPSVLQNEAQKVKVNNQCVNLSGARMHNPPTPPIPRARSGMRRSSCLEAMIMLKTTAS